MVTQEFQEAYKRLNTAQREAVDTIEGPVMVVAGPGTGKTQILTVRIANILLNSQVNPENILALTFTENAAKQMRRRLVEMIGTPGYKVWIATFHGFCNEIIQEYPEDFPDLASFQAITEVEQIEIMEEILLNTELKYLKPFGDPLYHLKNILSAISDLKKEGVTPEIFSEAIKVQKKDFEKIDDLYHEKGKYAGQIKGVYQDLQKTIYKNAELLILYQKYQKKLKMSKGYDFNDMLLFVKLHLEADKNLLLRLQERYQYILVDEHQDTNNTQNKIVELLASFYDEPNLFVVGDEKQAIYRFQGASLENFLFFKTLYPTAKLINLDRNYRSHQLILDAARSFLPGEVRLMAEKKILEEKLKFVNLNDYHAEYEFLAEDIRKKVSCGINPSEIAILARRNSDLIEASKALQRKGISYTFSADTNILNDLEIQKLILILKAINNFGSEIDLLKVMHVDLFNIDPLDIYRLQSEALKKQVSIFDLKKPKAITNLIDQLKKWNKASCNMGFEDLLINVINESGFKARMIKSQRRFEILDKLIALFEETKIKALKNPQFNLSDFISYLNLLEKHGLGIDKKNDSKYKDSVNLMTVHKSKGLEFDYVYIINTFDGRWGNSRRRGSSFQIPWEILGMKLEVGVDENEDERRLFYVALTRARKGIILSYSKTSLEGKEQIASQYITEINSKFIEEDDVSDFEKEFLKNKEIIFDKGDHNFISAKNHKFFKELFLERGLSATGLNDYLKCPWRYFFKDLLKFPEVKNKNLIFGSAVHYALDCYIKIGSKNLSAKFLIDKYTEAINKEYLSKVDNKELLEKGKQILTDFFYQVIPNWPKEIQSELEIKGVKYKGITLNGRIDMVDLSQGKDVIIHDFKTGKPKSRGMIDGSNEKSETNYLRQLTFYKLLLDNYKNGVMKTKTGVIDFVEPDEKGRFKSEIFEITKKDVEELEGLIERVSKEIVNLEFWDKRCEEKNCEYCTLRELIS